MLSFAEGGQSFSQSLLPPVTTAADYIQVQADAELFVPAVQAICRRHGLSTEALVRLGEGTNVVFALGDHCIVKLFPPYWRQPFRAERAVSEHIYNRLSVTTPQVYAHGDLEGWPYLVMTRLRGRYFKDVWTGLDESAQLRLVTELGRLLAEMHALPRESAPDLDADWHALVQTRLRTCVERHREQGVSERWLQQIPSFLASAEPLYPPGYRPVIVSGDVHQYHLLVEEEGGRWRLSGLFDFDDARIGFHEYDLAATALFIMNGRRELLRAFFLSYGYEEPQLEAALSRRLLAYTLLHRYRPLNWVRQELVRDTVSTTLEQLARTIYPFE